MMFTTENTEATETSEEVGGLIHRTKALAARTFLLWNI